MDSQGRQSIAPAMSMLERILEPSLLTLTVGLIMDDFGDAALVHAVFGKFEGYLNMAHLAAAAHLPRTLNDLMVQQMVDIPLSPATIASLILCSMISGLKLWLSSPDTKELELRTILVALQQQSAENPQRRDVAFSRVSAHWLFRTYMAEDSSHELGRLLCELLKRRPLPSDSGREVWLMQANRVKTMVTCHAVALERKAALRYPTSAMGSINQKDVKMLSAELAASQPVGYDSVTTFLEAALTAWKADHGALPRKPLMLIESAQDDSVPFPLIDDGDDRWWVDEDHEETWDRILRRIDEAGNS